MNASANLRIVAGPAETQATDRVTDGEDYVVELLRDAAGIPARVTISGKNLHTGEWMTSERDLQPPAPLYVGMSDALKKAGKDPRDFLRIGQAFLRRSVADTVSLWGAEKDAADDAKEQADAASLLAAVPGLDMLRAARNDDDRYSEQFARMMEDEGNDGARPPASRRYDSAALRKQYPRAALYLDAESYSYAAHWAKAKAGEEAMEILASGGSETDARAKLDNWLTDNDVYVD